MQLLLTAAQGPALWSATRLTQVGVALSLLAASASCSSADVLFSSSSSDEGAPLHELIAGEISAATSSVHVAVYTFTVVDIEGHDPIIDALTDAQARGLDVKVCTDRDQEPTNRAAIDRLTDGGVEVGLAPGHGGGIMHHKFVVVDSHTVLTGSFNFTRSAEDINDENLLRLANPDLAAQYEAEFAELSERCF